MSDIIDLADTDIPKGTKVIGIEYRICAVLVCRPGEPDVDDEICYDKKVIVLDRDVVEFVDNQDLTVDNGSLADNIEQVKQLIAGNGTLPHVQSFLTNTKRLTPEIVGRLEEIADAHDEMIQIDIPVKMEIEWTTNALVEVPRRALKRVIESATGNPGVLGQPVAELIYKHNPNLDDDVEEQAEEYRISNMSPTCLVEVEKLSDIKGSNEWSRKAVAEIKSALKTK